MNKRERVLRTLAIEEPDKVPMTEMDIDVPADVPLADLRGQLLEIAEVENIDLEMRAAR